MSISAYVRFPRESTAPDTHVTKQMSSFSQLSDDEELSSLL